MAPVRRRPLTARDVPALADFARGYLHQEFAVEYQNAPGAIAAFRLDASPVERAALDRDLTRVMIACRRWPAARLAAFFSDALGSAWAPGSADELLVLRQALNAQ